MRRHKYFCLVVFMFLMSIFFSISSCAVIVEPGVSFEVGNEIYVFNNTMNFSVIMIGDSWIRFNTTDFNISSSNSITINMSFINNSITSAGVDDSLIRFNASCSSGLVYFNLSGFETSTCYIVYVDGVDQSLVSDSSGIVSFSYEGWSIHSFDIRKGGNVTQVRVSYRYMNVEDVVVDSFSILVILAVSSVVIVGVIVFYVLFKGVNL